MDVETRAGRADQPAPGMWPGRAGAKREPPPITFGTARRVLCQWSPGVTWQRAGQSAGSRPPEGLPERVMRGSPGGRPEPHLQRTSAPSVPGPLPRLRRPSTFSSRPACSLAAALPAALSAALLFHVTPSVKQTSLLLFIPPTRPVPSLLSTQAGVGLLWLCCRGTEEPGLCTELGGGGIHEAERDTWGGRGRRERGRERESFTEAHHDQLWMVGAAKSPCLPQWRGQPPTKAQHVPSARPRLSQFGCAGLTTRSSTNIELQKCSGRKN